MKNTMWLIASVIAVVAVMVSVLVDIIKGVH